MNDKQSEALRLADLLVKATVDKDLFTTALGFDAANELSVLDYKAKEQTAELRRLHEANEAFGKRQEWWNERMFELEQQRDAAWRERDAAELMSLALKAQRDELLEALKMNAQALVWIAFGECRGFHDSLPSALEASEAARAAIAKSEEQK